MRTRFAPSPTGHLHIGHARAALEAFQFAERQNGTCLLRIEDTDHTRCKTDYTQGLCQDLDWLGFDWPVPTRVQSRFYPDYAKVVMDLVERGLAYPCLLTRGEIQQGQNPSPESAPEEFHKARVLNALSESSYRDNPSLPFAVRLDLEKAVTSLNKAAAFEDIGPLNSGRHDVLDALKNRIDPVIARKDIGCSYMIAGTHDDAFQNMTHIVRGADLFGETALQVLIQNLMRWETPLYYHHGLVCNDLGEKLSKRNLDTTIKLLREVGHTPEDIWKLAKV
jgi:glutamyl-Q tRNA(Asp) synthetase